MGDCHQHFLLIPNMETRDGFQNKSIIKLTKYKFHYIIPIILLFKEKNG
jgi:hypothetical protein